MTGLLLKFILCAIISVAVMFLMILVGRGVDLFNDFLLNKLSGVTGRKAANFIINRVMFVGVIFHELSHALVACLTGARVTKIRFFVLFSKDTLGYVDFVTTGSRFNQAVQKSLVSCAPVLTAFITIPLFLKFAFSPERGLLGFLGCLYCALSILCHASMSRQDQELYSQGAPRSFVIVLLAVFVITTLFF